MIDLGTGSGAIALAVKQAHPGAAVTATDASAAALGVARRNARRLGLEVDFVETSWWHGLDGRRFGIVLANPPYIREGDAALDALRHEPRAALTPGGDGLAALREIVTGARAHLAPGGWLLLEHGFDQADEVRALLGGAGLEAVETRRDLAGHPRATGGRRPAGARRPVTASDNRDALTHACRKRRAKAATARRSSRRPEIRSRTPPPAVVR